MERKLAASLCFWSGRALTPSLSQFQCLSFICDTTTWSQALGSAHGVYFLAYISIPWGDAAPGVMPFPAKRATQLSHNGHWQATLSLSLSGTASLLSKPGNSHVAFARPPHPWVSLCSAGKPLESRNPRNNRWWEFMKDVPAPCSRAGMSKLPLNETTGVQQEAFCHRMELSAGCKAFLGSSTNTPVSESHCTACTANCASRQINCKVTEKKSCRWRPWSCLKKYNTQETEGGRKEPAFVKSEHVNSVASILSHLLRSPPLQSVSHTEA